MKNVLSKWRIKNMIFYMRVKNLWLNITEPFRIAYKMFKRSYELIKINLETHDRWERYLKIKKLEQQDKLKLRRSKYFLLRTKIITTYIMTSVSIIPFVSSKEYHEEVDESVLESSKAEFLKKKEELCCLVNELKTYDEIKFDTEIETKIQNWKFEDFETEAELKCWQVEFVEYVSSLDII